MDELKKYLRQHEAFLDVDVPDEKGIWERIESSGKKRTPQRSMVVLYMPYAAVACIIIVIALGIIRLTSKDTQPPGKPVIVTINLPLHKDTLSNTHKPVNAVAIARKKATPVIKSQPAKAVENIGNGYAQLVRYQLTQLRNTPVYAEAPNYFTDFKLQLKQMDNDEALLRSDMKVYGLNDQLLEHLINIYQQKLKLLKSLQGEINKMNNKVREKQSNDELNPYYLNI